jgi:hypothetical protein
MSQKIKVHRFCFVQDDLNIAMQLLEEKGYNRLDDAVESQKQPKKIIVDNSVKHFWIVSQNIFENSIETIKNAFKEELYKLDYKSIKDI